ncbi:MAG: DUF4827 family protein [Bacteroidales bacterium]|nr:DUF4827 family protein [Bacteroidales bacterium]
MKLSQILSPVAAAIVLVPAVSSCSDSKTYAELLTDETHYVNSYLADQRVVDAIPADSVFEYGEDAPYYRIDEDGNMYMQVIDPGTPGNDVKSNELIYFRFTRYNLQSYVDGKFLQAEGNDDVLGGNFAFRYGNYELSSSYSYGSGIQKPLEFLPIDCQVNIVIKSQYGMPSEMSNVVPWLYSLRYFRPKF